MSAYFLKSGNTYRVTKKEALDLTEKLPAGNYIIQKNEMTGELFLEKIESFQPIGKVYGDSLKNTDRIVNTFLDRPATTGVMLTGEKGSGKTLLTKNVCMKLAEMDIPTIVINAPWCGDKFNNFIQSIDQPCAVLFDEFEKTYDKEDQEKVLTLLDGVFPTKKLFLLTCNDKWRVDSHMRNRPGRIFYMMDFKGLDADFIREYCSDKLNNKQYINSIVNVGSLFAEFNFDMLKALVEEMNRYNESPQEALAMLNAKPEFDSGTQYEIGIVHDGKKIDYGRGKFEGNPLQPKGVAVEFDPDPENEEGDWEYKVFNPNALVKVDAHKGEFIFEDNGTTLTLTRIKQQQYRYYDAF